MSEPHFRPQEGLEELQLERYMMEFLHSDGDTCTFMRPETFEQIEVPGAILGSANAFLQPGMGVPVEFFEGEPISVVFPASRGSTNSQDGIAFTLATGQRVEGSHFGKWSRRARPTVHRSRRKHACGGEDRPVRGTGPR